MGPIRNIATHIVAALISCLVIACCIPTEAAHAQSDDKLTAKIDKLLADKKYNEAIPLLKQFIEQQQKAGRGDTAVTSVHRDMLALLYVSQGQQALAEPILRKSLEARERVVGRDSKDLIDPLNSLGAVLHSLNRTEDAIPFLERAVRISEAQLPPEHPTLIQSLDNLATTYAKTDRDAKAEPLLLRVLAAQEKSRGVDQPGSEQVIYDLANVYRRLGNFAKAERFYLRVLDIVKKSRGELAAHTLAVTYELAEFYGKVGSSVNAMVLYDRVIQGRERTLGPDDPETLSAVYGLALFHARTGNFKGAEPLFLRLYQADLRQRGADDEQTRISFQNLAFAYFKLEKYETAEPLFLRLLEARERSTGRDSPESLAVAQVLGTIYFELRQYTKAEQLLRRIVDAPNMNDRKMKSGAYLLLAELYHRQKKWQQARAFLAEHFKDTSGVEDYDADGVLNPSGRLRRIMLIKIVSRIVQEGLEPVERNAAGTFETAQLLFNSQAAQSLRRMAVRSLPQNGKLGDLIREHQDLSDDVQRRTVAHAQLWNRYDNVYVGPFTYDSKNGLDLKLESINPQRNDVIDVQEGSAAKLAALNARVKQLDLVLAREFPQYADLIQPAPLSVAGLQAQLLPNEALALFLGTEPFEPLAGETFVWVVTKDGTRWVRSELDASTIAREVQALRCGLDEEAWSGPDCSKLLGVTYSQEDAKAKKPLPFSQERAHQLYKALFGQIEDLIRDKHLLLVPSGALAQLPFHVLVTERGGTAASEPDLRKVAWLARKHAITVLPTVSSLKTLRRIARPSAGSKPMLAIGNPLLNGDPGRPEEAAWVQLSRAKQVCPQALWQRVSGFLEKRRSVRRISMRGGYADLSELRFQVPLHETADEVCAVAKDLKVGPDDILLGARATEATIKQLSSEDRLRAYRVLYFATHGTVAGQIGGTNEPGLILTPPQAQSELDDGFLSASEVASLKLDAEWVILSACNTAAGGANDAEALAGLARAFIYAGARSLLVSHWAVDSAATAKLVSSAAGEVARDPSGGRAEALRRAMLMMIDRGEPRHAHPAYWAPFVLVGEGAPAR